MQKKKLGTQGLRLSRETIHRLATERLEQAAGAASRPCPTSLPCPTCFETCTPCPTLVKTCAGITTC